MMSKEVQVTLKIKGSSPFELKEKINVLENISRLSEDKQSMILELCANPKYLEALHQNKELLKSFIK